MSKVMRDAISELTAKLQKQLDEAAETKKAINTLSRSLGDPEPYPDVSTESAGGAFNIRPDLYYSKPLAGSVREYLKMRGHAAPVADILDGLKRGGFDFGKDSKFAERNLRISLAKNTAYFVQVRGSDAFGLREFYPDLKEEKEEEDVNGKNAKKRSGKKGKDKASASEPKLELPEVEEGKKTADPKQS